MCKIFLHRTHKHSCSFSHLDFLVPLDLVERQSLPASRKQKQKLHHLR